MGDDRYGFNGKEKSDEIDPNGNSNTPEFWQYDSRLGRRWNVDPKPTVSLSPYSSFFNSPIWHNDVYGDSPTLGNRLWGLGKVIGGVVTAGVSAVGGLAAS